MTLVFALEGVDVIDLPVDAIERSSLPIDDTDLGADRGALKASSSISSVNAKRGFILRLFLNLGVTSPPRHREFSCGDDLSLPMFKIGERSGMFANSPSLSEEDASLTCTSSRLKFLVLLRASASIIIFSTFLITSRLSSKETVA